MFLVKKINSVGWVSPWARVSARSVATILLVNVAFSVSGCGIFSAGKDESVLQMTSYRKVNPNCGFKAESPEIDVSTFRSIYRCFNANHALDHVVALFDHLSDEQLEPIVRTSNKYILTNK